MAARDIEWTPILVAVGIVVPLLLALVVMLTIGKVVEAYTSTTNTKTTDGGKTTRNGRFWDTVGQVLGSVMAVVV